MWDEPAPPRVLNFDAFADRSANEFAKAQGLVTDHDGVSGDPADLATLVVEFGRWQLPAIPDRYLRASARTPEKRQPSWIEAIMLCAVRSEVLGLRGEA